MVKIPPVRILVGEREGLGEQQRATESNGDLLSQILLFAGPQRHERDDNSKRSCVM